jgi:hypothetical protein
VKPVEEGEVGNLCDPLTLDTFWKKFGRNTRGLVHALRRDCQKGVRRKVTLQVASHKRLLLASSHYNLKECVVSVLSDAFAMVVQVACLCYKRRFQIKARNQIGKEARALR